MEWVSRISFCDLAMIVLGYPYTHGFFQGPLNCKCQSFPISMYVCFLGTSPMLLPAENLSMSCFQVKFVFLSFLGMGKFRPPLSVLNLRVTRAQGFGWLPFSSPHKEICKSWDLIWWPSTLEGGLDGNWVMSSLACFLMYISCPN